MTLHPDYPLPDTSDPIMAPFWTGCREGRLLLQRETDTGREVSEAEWASFLNDEVTPRFPDGLSVLDVRGQSRNLQGRIEREQRRRHSHPSHPASSGRERPCPWSRPAAR